MTASDSSGGPRLKDVLGPGLITGASDDDPSGIATYSQAGAQFGYALGWTLLLTYPLMCAIQMISARVGRVTGHGLADNMRRHYPTPVLYTLIGLLLVANTINHRGGPRRDGGGARPARRRARPLLYVGGFAIVTVLLEVFMSYYALRLGPAVADAIAVRLCGDGVRGRRPLARRSRAILSCPISNSRALI